MTTTGAPDLARGDAAAKSSVIRRTTAAWAERNRRCSYAKAPRTGKKVARPDPADQWEIVPSPSCGS